MRLGTLEILLILVLALVIFGGKRLSGVGKALGTSIREFNKELKNGKDEPTNTTEKDEEIKAE